MPPKKRTILRNKPQNVGDAGTQVFPRKIASDNSQVKSVNPAFSIQGRLSPGVRETSSPQERTIFERLKDQVVRRGLREVLKSPKKSNSLGINTKDIALRGAALSRQESAESSDSSSSDNISDNLSNNSLFSLSSKQRFNPLRHIKKIKLSPEQKRFQAKEIKESLAADDREAALRATSKANYRPQDVAIAGRHVPIRKKGQNPGEVKKLDPLFRKSARLVQNLGKRRGEVAVEMEKDGFNPVEYLMGTEQFNHLKKRQENLEKPKQNNADSKRINHEFPQLKHTDLPASKIVDRARTVANKFVNQTIPVQQFMQDHMKKGELDKAKAIIDMKAQQQTNSLRQHNSSNTGAEWSADYRELEALKQKKEQASRSKVFRKASGGSVTSRSTLASKTSAASKPSATRMKMQAPEGNPSKARRIDC